MKYKIPLYQVIELPDYISGIVEEPSVRRLRLIKQLGLKSFTKYSGANHTRFEHSLGALYLAEKLYNKLVSSSLVRFRDEASILQSHEKEIISAAFLHDIGHGPFSHVMDNVLKSKYNIGHEQMVDLFLRNDLGDTLSEFGVNTDEVSQIIQKKHKYIYLSDIIHGDLDVDRMDYLLRDAHYADIEYKFGSESLINSMSLVNTKLVDIDEERILEEIKSISNEIRKLIEPNIKELTEECRVGVVGEEGIVLAEMLLIIRKTMYANVYFESESRIAEKMLEKAILKITNNIDLSDIKLYERLDDYELFRLLQNSDNNFCKEIPPRLKYKDLYENIQEYKIEDISEDVKEIILDDEKMLEKENDLASEIGISADDIILDYVSISGLEPGAVYVLQNPDDEYAKPIEKISLLAQSLTETEDAKLKIYIDKNNISVSDEDIISILNRNFTSE